MPAEIVQSLEKRYLAALEASRKDLSARSPMQDARRKFAEQVSLAAAETTQRPELEQALRSVYGAVRRLYDQQQAPWLAVEVGAFSTLLDVVKHLAEDQIPSSAVSVLRKPGVVNLLSHLAVYGEERKGHLASLLASLKGGKRAATTAHRSKVTRLTAQMEAAGLIAETKAGRERLVHITRRGSQALASLHTGIVRGELRQGRSEVLEPRNTLQLLNERALEREMWPANDRTRFHLFIAGLHATMELQAQSTHTHSDLYFAASITNFPIGWTPVESDEELFDRLRHRWSLKDEVRRDLVECLIRYQTPAERDAPELYGLLFRLGKHLPPNSSLALLWLPCATTVAFRAWTKRSPSNRHQVISLLESLTKRLFSGTQNGLALHYLGVISRKASKDRSREFLSIWRRIPRVALWRGSYDEQDVRAKLRLMQLQLVYGSKANVDLVQLFDAVEIVFLSVLMRQFPETKLFFHDLSLQDPMGWTEWVMERSDDVAPVLREIVTKTAKIRGLVSHLVRTIKTARKKIGNALTPDVRELFDLHQAQARWLLGQTLSEAERIKQTKDWYVESVQNNFWTPTEVAIDVSRAAQ